MKISCCPLLIYGCFVSQYHEKTNRNIFLPKCPEIDDTLVLKPKKNLLASFWLKNHQLTLWRQEQIVSAAGRNLRNLNFIKILLGKTFKGRNWTVSCQKIQKTPERGENYENLNLSKSCSGLRKFIRGPNWTGSSQKTRKNRENLPWWKKTFAVVFFSLKSRGVRSRFLGLLLLKITRG